MVDGVPGIAHAEFRIQNLHLGAHFAHGGIVKMHQFAVLLAEGQVPGGNQGIVHGIFNLRIRLYTIHINLL